jgi:glycosyltransferase involved in cell wall biosynthesis
MATRARIFQATNNLEARFGGPPFVVKGIQDTLDKDFSHNLIVFGETDFRNSNSINIPTFLNNHYGFFLGFLPREVKNMIKASDLILLHGFYLYSNLMILFQCRDKKIALMPHGTFEIFQQKKSPMRKFIFDCVFNFLIRKNSLRIFVASDSEIAGAQIKFPTTQITVVGIGVENPPMINLKKKSNGKLLCLSRITEKKRIDLCIKALELLRQQESGNQRLEIAGEGSELLKSKLIAQAKSLNVLTFLTFSGLLKDLEKWQAITDSSILLLPSMNENFAISVAECISAGVPVIVSKNVALHEFVQEFDCGVVIDNLSPENVFRATLKIESNYSTYVNNCLRNSYLLSWERVSRNWSKAIFEVIGSK